MQSLTIEPQPKPVATAEPSITRTVRPPLPDKPRRRYRDPALLRKLTLIALWGFAIGYGVLVEIRGALLHNRHTDVDT